MPPDDADLHKNYLGKRQNPKNANHTEPGLIFWDLGVWGSGTPLRVTFGPEIENLCENHMLQAFHILCEKYFCKQFFGLCFVKIGLF